MDLMSSQTYLLCCGSWMCIPDPGSKNSNERQGWKLICSHTFFLETKYWFWIWDPEKNPFRIPGSKRHRIRNTEKKVPDPDQLTSLITNLLLNRFLSLEACCSFSAAWVTLGLANSNNIKGTLSQDFWLKAVHGSVTPKTLTAGPRIILKQNLQKIHIIFS